MKADELKYKRSMITRTLCWLDAQAYACLGLVVGCAIGWLLMRLFK